MVPANDRKETDEALVFRVYEGILKKLEGRKDVVELLRKATEIPRAWRIVYTTVTLDGQVINGGFNQYYYNTNLQFGQEVIEDFAEMGDPSRSEIAREASEVLVAEAALQVRMRAAGTLEAFADSYKESRLGDVDTKYFRIEDKTPFYGVLARYIRAHSEDFAGIIEE